jgi:hypothetical protein
MTIPMGRLYQDEYYTGDMSETPPKHEKVPYTPFELVGDIDDTEEEILRELEGLEYDENGDAQLPRAELVNGRWQLDSSVPGTVRRMFEKAVSDEASRHRRYRFDKAFVSVRLIKPEHEQFWRENQNIHSDATGTVSGYIATSAPGTVQYLADAGTNPKLPVQNPDALEPAEDWYKREGMDQGFRASSILPMKLYHMDENTYHSVPWDLHAQNSEGKKKNRFFFRVLFLPA